MGAALRAVPSVCPQLRHAGRRLPSTSPLRDSNLNSDGSQQAASSAQHAWVCMGLWGKHAGDVVPERCW